MGNSDQLAVELATSISGITHASSSLSSLASSLITSSASLSSASSSFSSVVEKIEQRFKDLATWEESLVERKKILDELYENLEKKEAKVKEEEDALARKLKELKEKEEAWEEKEKKIKANLDAVADMVTLNVGGQIFAFSKEVLLAHDDSLFLSLLSSDLYRNKDTIFINRSPKYFPLIADFLREGKINTEIKAKDLGGVRQEFEFYRLPFPEIPREKRESTPPETTIFDPAGSLLTGEWKKVVRSWLPDSHFILLYKGSKDGFTPEAYHEKCDARGPLFTVIMSAEGFLFGGYILTVIADDSSAHNERHILAPNSFLFTLTNPHVLAPTTFPLLPGNWQTLYTPKEHIHMGWGLWGYDMALSKTPQLDKKSYFGFPYAFKDKHGHGKSTFTGTEYFTIRDVEVFSVVPTYADPENI